MGRFENLKFDPGLKTDGFWDLNFGQGRCENCIRPFKKYQNWVQMIPNGFLVLSGPELIFLMGWMLRFGRNWPPAQVHRYSTALWLHGHENPRLQRCSFTWVGQRALWIDESMKSLIVKDGLSVDFASGWHRSFVKDGGLPGMQKCTNNRQECLVTHTEK